jgi:hypothetical protein
MRRKFFEIISSEKGLTFINGLNQSIIKRISQIVWGEGSQINNKKIIEGQKTIPQEVKSEQKKLLKEHMKKLESTFQPQQEVLEEKRRLENQLNAARQHDYMRKIKDRKKQPKEKGVSKNIQGNKESAETKKDENQDKSQEAGLLNSLQLTPKNITSADKKNEHHK